VLPITALPLRKLLATRDEAILVVVVDSIIIIIVISVAVAVVIKFPMRVRN